MKRSSEKNRFYRSAAAAAVIAALAWASSPVWADTGTVSMTEVTSSVPGAVEDTPAALSISGSGTLAETESENDLTQTVTSSGKPAVYLASDDGAITIRATESVIVAGTSPVLIASGSSITWTHGYSVAPTSTDSKIIIPDLISSSMSGGHSGSIDIEAGTKDAAGSITLGDGYILLAGDESGSPLSFTVNGEGTADSVVVNSSIVASGAGTTADLSLSGSQSSFSGSAEAANGAAIRLNVKGALDENKKPTGTISGSMTALNGGSVTVTASDTDASGAVFMAGPGGSVTVNLTGNSIQNLGTSYIAYVYGKGSEFKETAGAGTAITGNLMGLCGSHTEFQSDGEWTGDADLSSPRVISFLSEEVKTTGNTPLASSMSIISNGSWTGDAQVFFPDETATENSESPYYGLVPADAVLSVTSNGTWDGNAAASGRGTRLDITIGEQKAADAEQPSAVWTGDTYAHDKGTAKILVNGQWTGELRAEGLSDSTVTVNQGGVWRYAKQNTYVQAAAVSLMSLSESDGYTTLSLDLESEADSDSDSDSASASAHSSVAPLLTVVYPQQLAPVTANITGGSHAAVTVDGNWYGSAVLSDSSAMEVTIGKSGAWTYAAPDATGSGGYITTMAAVSATGSSYIPTFYSSGEGGMVTAGVTGGSTMAVTVDGTWTGSAMVSYWDQQDIPYTTAAYYLTSAAAVNNTDEAEETASETAATGFEDNVKSFDATVNGEWVGSLYSDAGAYTHVTVGESGVWRYDPDATLLSGYSTSSGLPYNVRPAFMTALLLNQSHFEADIDGTLYGAVAAGSDSASFKITIGKNGVWTNRYPNDPVVEGTTETEGSEENSDFVLSSTRSGPFTALLAMKSSGTVNVNGEWTGDAFVTDLSDLTVNIGETGLWQLSPDNETMSAEVTFSSGQTKTVTGVDPVIAFVENGASLKFDNKGRMIGSITVYGKVDPSTINTDSDATVTAMLALGTQTASDDASETDETETQLTKSQVDGTVSGHWTGSLYTAFGAKSKVTVEAGGLWDNTFVISNDIMAAFYEGQATVIDNGTLRGTVFSVSKGTLLDITVGSGGLWEVGRDPMSERPGVAFAGDSATLNIDVKAGGAFTGDVLAMESAAVSVKADGAWTGNAVSDAASLTVSGSGSWNGNIWAKNGGTAVVNLSGTWTGTVKDTELETPAAYLGYKANTPPFSSDESDVVSALMTSLAVTTEPDTPTVPESGLVSVNLSGPAAVWNMTESTTVKALNLGSGTVSFPAPASSDTFTGTTLTVDGDFSGDGGTIVMNTALESDDSATDLLKISGNASGSAYVRVNNVGGKGSTTSDGIKVIEIAGDSAAVFKTAGTVRGGAYVYDLGKGTDGNWYLSSLYSPEPEPAPEPDIRKHKVRPEAAAYATNLYAANTLFSMKLSDRAGESAYTEALKDTARNAHGVWIRTEGGHTRHEMTDSQTTTRGDWGLVQVGGDIASWPASGAHRYHVGLMAGYAHETSKTGSSAVNYKAKGKVNGYSVGLYGTWMNSDPTGAGPYVDTWLSYQRFKNTVESSDMEVEESYHTKGFTASLEAGYTFALKDWKGSNGTENAARLRFETQVIRMGVRGGDHLESTRTLVQGTGAGNVRTRVGVTAYHLFSNSAKGSALKPYLSLNWFHDTKSFGSVMDGVTDKITGSRNFGEVKLGLEGKLTKNVNLWGAAGYQMGSHGLRNAEALLGLKYLF